MSSLPQSVPASFRKPAQVSRFAASLLPERRSAQPAPQPGQQMRTPIVINSALNKGRTQRLPHEPEDARLTGVTRSLHRRLLALNVGGSLVNHGVVSTTTRIA